MDFGLVITSIQSAIDSVSAVQSNAVLRERLAFIYEQMDVLQKAHAATEKELAEANIKIAELSKEVAANRAKDEFVFHRTAAFRKEPSGGYVRAVYCPNCFKQVGSDFGDMPYHCASCGWLAEFGGRELGRVMESLP